MALTYSYRQGTGEIHTFKGTAPTEREDGTPFDAATEVDYYKRYSVTTLPDGTEHWEDMHVQLVDGAFSEPLDVDAVAPDTYRILYTTVDKNGLESKPSEEIILEILPPLAKPLPPTNITVG